MKTKLPQHLKATSESISFGYKEKMMLQELGQLFNETSKTKIVHLCLFHTYNIFCKKGENNDVK